MALEVAYDCLRVSQEQGKSSNIAQFKGYVWTTAKDRDLSLDTLLDRIAYTLEYPGITQQSFPDKKLSVERLFRAASYLLVVDNFETIKDNDLVEFVRTLPAPSKVLITTREQNLHWAYVISLRGLDEAEAITLIRNEGRRLDLEYIEKAEEQNLKRLHQATGGAPLAIRWTIGQIRQTGQSLDAVIESLQKGRGNLFEDIFSRSWSLLPKKAQQVLLVMPFFVVPAERDAIESASGVANVDLDEALGQTVVMWLIETSDDHTLSYRRYSIHPLTRSFAMSYLA